MNAAVGCDRYLVLMQWLVLIIRYSAVIMFHLVGVLMPNCIRPAKNCCYNNSHKFTCDQDSLVFV